ncbi:MAG TPA: SOS response-associated peptidase family protein [Steroidobacteraceae bacterium]|nr:SOS response-associated peptidase family protein [Steroidobacteraceae bacterium]
MCYSAQIQASYMKYLRETGAEMDIDQFVEIFGARVADSSIRIPRAVERWFDTPATDAERQIKELIDQHREAEITKLEREVFAQRKRLADAERTLALKITKAATESKRIAGDKVEKALTRLERLKATKPHPAEARIFPLHYAPIVLQDGARRVMRLARYHCRKPNEPEFIDRKFPGLYNARRDSLGKYWKEQFGATHGVMVVESIFENVEREGKNQVLHFVPRPANTMLIACLCSTWQDPKGGRPLLSFAAITDEPPPEVAAAGHDRMIINLKPEHLDAWLSPAGKSLDELQAILSDRQAPYYEHEVMAA